jgi:hypothetical protein
MPHLHIMKNKRLAAGIIAFLMLFIMLFSASFIAIEADHDCTGEECPICACIAQCENTLHQIGDGVAVQAAVIVPVVFMLILAFLLATDFPKETLVSRKVRLNN